MFIRKIVAVAGLIFLNMSAAHRPYEPHTGVFASSSPAAAAAAGLKTPEVHKLSSQERAVYEFREVLMELKAADPHASIDERALARAIEHIHTMQFNTPKKRRQQAIVDLYYTITAKPSPSRPPLTELQQHALAAERLSSPKVREAARKLKFEKETPRGPYVLAPRERIIEDVDHLFGGDERGGCHHLMGELFEKQVLAPSTAAGVPVLQNKKTLIVQGMCKIGENLKLSTLFPFQVAPEEVFSFVREITASDAIAVHERGRLVRSKRTGVYAIQFPYEERILNSTTYPILGFANIEQPGIPYELFSCAVLNAAALGWKKPDAQIIVTAEMIVGLLHKLSVHFDELIDCVWQPTTDSKTVVVDIAGVLREDAYNRKLPKESVEKHIRKGLFVRIPFALIDALAADGGALSARMRDALRRIEPAAAAV